MDESGEEPLQELEQLLDEMETQAPTREVVAGTQVVYRNVAEDEPVDDSLPIDQLVDEDESEDDDSSAAEAEVAAAKNFQPTLFSGAVAAVDCGIIRLGETENGLIIALRASIITDDGEESKIRLYRTGPMYLHNAYKAQTLYQMGKHLGRPDFFVDVDMSDPTHPIPTKVKSGVANDTHQYGDRFRNWFERLVQRATVTSIHNGVILFDGALTLRTRDTPRTYLEQLARLASNNGNALIAISKQSLLQVRGKAVRFWLNDVPNRACYRMLSGMMRDEGAEERVLGNAYAVRFSVLGPTLRMDVKPIKGQSDDEAISQLYSSSFMRGGYPDILVRAHMHSYFTSPHVIQLQAQASVKYSLVPEGEVELTGIFGPFGGRFK